MQQGAGRRPKSRVQVDAHPEFERDRELVVKLGLSTRDAFYALPEGDQEEWIAAWEADQAKCPRCGLPRSVCSDPETEWYPQRTICYASAAVEVARRLYAERFENREWHDGTFEPQAKEMSSAKPWHYSDGVTIWASMQDLTPDDHFLGAPVPESVGEAVQSE